MQIMGVVFKYVRRNITFAATVKYKSPVQNMVIMYHPSIQLIPRKCSKSMIWSYENHIDRYAFWLFNDTCIIGVTENINEEERTIAFNTVFAFSLLLECEVFSSACF